MGSQLVHASMHQMLTMHKVVRQPAACQGVMAWTTGAGACRSLSGSQHVACKGVQAGRRLLGTSLGLLERQVGQGGNSLLVQQVLAAERAKSAR